MKLWCKKGLVLLFCCVLLSSCGMAANERTADQWLTLSYSGLTGKDDYRFTGSILQGFENGVSLTPHVFEGVVQQHKQMRLNSEVADGMIHNPASELDFLVNNYDSVVISKFTVDEVTLRKQVLLHIVEKEVASTKRWKEQLREELTSVSISVASEAAEQNVKKKLQVEIDTSQKELEAILETLKVNAEYDLLIDMLTLLPTKLDGQIKLQYRKDDVPYSEYRTSNIRFDMFEKMNE